MFIRLEEKMFAPFTSNGTAFFNSEADFLTDTPRTVQSPPLGGIASVKTRYMFTSIPGVYIQDDWKVRSNITLNIGLRYEMETIPTEKYGRIANLPFLWTNATTPNCSTCTNKNFDSNPTTKNFEPRVGFAWDPFKDGKTSVRGGFGLFDALPLPYELALNNAQTSPGHVNVNVQGCGFITQPAPPAPPIPCVNRGEFPAVNAAVLNEFLNPAAAPIPSQTWNFVERNPKRNYIYQWNLNLQRQLASTLSLPLAYAGSRGKHNPYQTDDLNTVFPTKVAGNRWLFPVVPSGVDSKGSTEGVPLGTPVACSSPLAAPPVGTCGNVVQPQTGIVPGQIVNVNVSGIQSTVWQSKSWYNALQVELEKRMSHGLQAEVSFTWSKTMDTTSGSFAGDNFAGDLNPTIPYWDLHLIKGLSDFNVSRNLVTNLLWQVPVRESLHGPLGFIAKGWELGGILTLSDGVPFWPFTVAGDFAGMLMSEPYAIPDRVPGCKLTNPGNPNQYINPACLTFPVAPSGINPATQCDQAFILQNPALPANTCANLVGNLGRNTYIGPGSFQLDYSMVKNTKIPKISETFNVQFRAEFFNLLNRANFAPPVANLDFLGGSAAPFTNIASGSPTAIGAAPFGQITSTQGPERQIQFGLKFIW
jgi:hypothetical protein